MKSYNKQTTIDALQNELLSMETLYQANCVNWTGKTNDTEAFYSEVLANELLRNLKVFDNIKPIPRPSTYCRDNHCKVEMDICNSSRNEEMFAKRLTGLKLEGLGLMIDYQIPLKGTRADKGVGKIDLLSFNEETNTLYLIELKYKDSKETLLRTSLEIFTYSKIVDQQKLLNDYKAAGHIKTDDVSIESAVLVVPNCQAYDELEDVEMGDRPKLKALLLALGIRCFTMEMHTYETEL